LGQRPLAIDVTIRDLATDRELSEAVSLQKMVWQFDDRDVVTEKMMLSCNRAGGLTLGAFSRDGRILGFLFGFPAWAGGFEFHHSHMLAIHPRVRDAGIGTRLKQVQRERARQRVPLITWTYDPLEARNAHLNFNKLGVVVRRYYRDRYGSNPSSLLHRGIGTDRFLAEWWIDRTPPLPAAQTGIQKPVWGLQGATIGDLRIPGRVLLESDFPGLLVEIPDDIQDLKMKSPEIARQWRLKTRLVLTHYLERGWEVAGFRSGMESGRRIAYYRIIKRKGINARDAR